MKIEPEKNLLCCDDNRIKKRLIPKQMREEMQSHLALLKAAMPKKFQLKYYTLIYLKNQ